MTELTLKQMTALFTIQRHEAIYPDEIGQFLGYDAQEELNMLLTNEFITWRVSIPDAPLALITTPKGINTVHEILGNAEKMEGRTMHPAILYVMLRGAVKNIATRQTERNEAQNEAKELKGALRISRDATQYLETELNIVQAGRRQADRDLNALENIFNTFIEEIRTITRIVDNVPNHMTTNAEKIGQFKLIKIALEGVVFRAKKEEMPF